MKNAIRALAALLAASLICASPGPAAAIPAQTFSGDQILSRAGAANGLRSFSAPVQFDVQMHKPVSIKTGAQGIVYFKAPAQSALTITKMPPILGKFFRSSYAIDLAPQVWPEKYSVQSVSQETREGSVVYVLDATPKSDPSVDRVTFEVSQADYLPLSATWSYKDGSSVRLQMTARKTSGYALPQTESVAVSMPQYALDATVNFGSYSLNADVPASVFSP
jgi:hypothetical protein